MDSATEVPLYMSGKIIGMIRVFNDGSFTGGFNAEAMEILKEGINSGAKNVTFENLFGLFAHHKPNTQERWNAYLAKPDGEQEYWSVYSGLGTHIEYRNLHSEAEAREKAADLHAMTGKICNWVKQKGKERGL